MHPVAVVGIIVGGVVCLWGGYEIGTHLLDWISCRREQRLYEEYVRHYETNEKEGLLSTEKSDDDDDDDDDDKPLSESSSYLRRRRTNNGSDEHIQVRGNSLLGMSHLEEENDDAAAPQGSMYELPPMLRPPSRESLGHAPSDQSISSWASVHSSPNNTDDDDDDSFALLSLPSSEGHRSPSSF